MPSLSEQASSIWREIHEQVRSYSSMCGGHTREVVAAASCTALNPFFDALLEAVAGKPVAEDKRPSPYLGVELLKLASAMCAEKKRKKAILHTALACVSLTITLFDFVPVRCRVTLRQNKALMLLGELCFANLKSDDEFNLAKARAFISVLQGRNPFDFKDLGRQIMYVYLVRAWEKSAEGSMCHKLIRFAKEDGALLPPRCLSLKKMCLSVVHNSLRRYSDAVKLDLPKQLVRELMEEGDFMPTWVAQVASDGDPMPIWLTQAASDLERALRDAGMEPPPRLLQTCVESTVVTKLAVAH
jgi:hypothetical protein